MMNDHEALSIFNHYSPSLRGLAYRVTGSTSDAEDAVQEVFIKWQKADKSNIETPAAWLTTVCTRQCLDMLKAAHKVRVNYVGTWLPEPMITVEGITPEDRLTPESHMELASSLSMAFLLLLERLTPKERAAYLLKEIFAYNYAEVSSYIGIKEAACRKLVSRARANINQGDIRHNTPEETQKKLLNAFQDAIRNGQPAPLTELLSDDIQLTADGGGKVIAIQKTLEGILPVTNFLTNVLSPAWQNADLVTCELNSQLGLLLYEADQITAALSFEYDGEREVKHIYILRNPDKLARLDDDFIKRKGVWWKR